MLPVTQKPSHICLSPHIHPATLMSPQTLLALSGFPSIYSGASTDFSSYAKRSSRTPCCELGNHEIIYSLSAVQLPRSWHPLKTDCPHLSPVGKALLEFLVALYGDSLGTS